MTEASHHRRPVVLFVDDESDLRLVSSLQLEFAGFEVKTAANVAEAIALFDAESFDAIVSDMSMPGGSGLVFLRHVRKKDQTKPLFFFFSSNPLLADAELIALGANAVFHKTVDFDTVITALKTHLFLRSERFRVDDFADFLPKLQVEVELEEGFQPAKLEDISTGGMGLRVQDAKIPTPGSPINIRLHFNADNWIDLQGTGEVRWVKTKSKDGKGAKLGLMFKELSNGTSITLERLLALMNPSTLQRQ